MIKIKSFKYIMFALFVAFCTLICTTCENPIMATWWPEEKPTKPVEKSGVNFGVVVFDTAGGTPQPKAVNIAWGNIVGRLRPIGRTGLGFAGWFDENGNPWNLETRLVKPEDDVNGDGVITLHAKWEVNYYKVEFDTNGAYLIEKGIQKFTIEEQLIAYNSKAVEPPPLQRGSEPQGFGGWWTKPGIVGNPNTDWGTQWNFANDPVTKNIKLYARWESNVRTVHFQVNGGMRPGILQTSGTINNAEMSPTIFTIFIPSSGAGGKVIDPGPLSKEGYAFDGWYTTPNFIASSQWNFSTDRIKETNNDYNDKFYLYAKWIPNLYLVTFVADGGTPAPASQQVEYGHKVTEPPPITKNEKAFRGWYTINLNGTKPTSAHDGSIWNFDTKVVNNVILYAGWDDKEYTVVFHLGNLPAGIHSVFKKPADQNVISNGKAIEPFMPSLPSGNKTSWSFLGWYSSIDPTTDNDAKIIDINKKDQTEMQRDAKLKAVEWSFSTPITNTNTNSNSVLNLYARWVEPAPDMIWVPRGSFVMGDSGVSGSPADYHSYPTRRVTVDGFYIGRYEITQVSRQDTNKSYFDVIVANPSQFYRNDVRPVDRVSWYDAVMYCNELTAQTPELVGEQVYTITNIVKGSNLAGTGGSGANARPAVQSIISADVTANFSNRGYRLPTEAEWEYAARGGNNSPGNYTYSGSNDSTLVAWYNETIKSGADAGSTQTVGTKTANALGIYDMSGNITEWVWDKFVPYKDNYYTATSGNISLLNPRGISGTAGPVNGDELRIRRGGGWSNAVGNVRSVVRNADAAKTSTWVNGFRVARNPSAIW